jgi:hypothetical protein
MSAGRLWRRDMHGDLLYRARNLTWPLGVVREIEWLDKRADVCASDAEGQEL